MSRNIDKDIREYRRLYWHRKDRTGGFYANDAIAIMQFTEEENKAWDVPRVSFTSFAVLFNLSKIHLSAMVRFSKSISLSSTPSRFINTKREAFQILLI